MVCLISNFGESPTVNYYGCRAVREEEMVCILEMNFYIVLKSFPCLLYNNFFIFVSRFYSPLSKVHMDHHVQFLVAASIPPLG